MVGQTGARGASDTRTTTTRERILGGEAELRVAEKRLEMQTAARATHAKLPKLRITPFKGTSSDWVRFENMFITQVHSRPVSDGEKFGYLPEMVVPKVRERVSNLKRSALGYKMAWEKITKGIRAN